MSRDVSILALLDLSSNAAKILIIIFSGNFLASTTTETMNTFPFKHYYQKKIATKLFFTKPFSIL
jgi:hypothetical protein